MACVQQEAFILDCLRNAIALRDLPEAKRYLTEKCLPQLLVADGKKPNAEEKQELSADMKEFLEYCLQAFLQELVVR